MGFLNGSGVTRLVTDLQARFAAIAHNHAASDITSGMLPISRGGTDAGSGDKACFNIGASKAASIASRENNYVDNIAYATENHAIGSHFMLGSTLRKATSAIAVGESITNDNSTTDTIQAQIDALRDSVSPTSVIWPSYTAATGVTVHGGTCYVRIGHIVILHVQVSVPAIGNGNTVITLNNIPTPVDDYGILTCSNSSNHRAFMLKRNKSVIANGDCASAGWLGGTVVYATND